MFYYLYQITNTLNGKIYVGVHKTKSLDDGYMGSGKIIRRAIEKHGLTNFSKVILEHFEDTKSMYAREAEVVTDEFLLREDVYNLRRGGYGGFEYINKNGLHGFSDADIAKLGRKLTNETLIIKYGSLSEFSKMGGNSSKEMGVGIHNKEMRKGYSKIGSSAARIVNSSLMWITNGVITQKVDKFSIIPHGFRKGRIGNFVNKKKL